MKKQRQAFFLLVSVIVVLVSGCGSSKREVRRAACVGDSITFGAGISQRAQQSYPAQLGRLLGSGWQVGNFGLPEATMLKKDAVPYSASPLFQQATDFRPQVVILMLGSNDSIVYNWVFKDDFAQDTSDMIDRFQNLPGHPTVFLCLPPPSFPADSFIRDEIIQTKINPLLRQVASEKQVPLIDMHTPFVDRPDLFSDGIHPTVEGAGQMARIVYQSLSLIRTGSGVSQTTTSS